MLCKNSIKLFARTVKNTGFFLFVEFSEFAKRWNRKNSTKICISDFWRLSICCSDVSRSYGTVLRQCFCVGWIPRGGRHRDLHLWGTIHTGRERSVNVFIQRWMGLRRTKLPWWLWNLKQFTSDKIKKSQCSLYGLLVATQSMKIWHFGPFSFFMSSPLWKPATSSGLRYDGISRSTIRDIWMWRRLQFGRGVHFALHRWTVDSRLRPRVYW